MKKSQFKIGEEVAILYKDEICNYGFIDKIIKTFGEVNENGEFIDKKSASEDMLQRWLEKRSSFVKRIDENTWEFGGRIYKHKDYKYIIKTYNGYFFSVANYRIRNKETYEAKLVLKTLYK